MPEAGFCRRSLGKSLTRTESAVSIIFWMLVVQSAIGMVLELPMWQWPSAQVWASVVVVAFCGTKSHYCFARAMQYADTTVVGWLVYSERLDVFTGLGVSLNLLRLPKVGWRAGRKA